MKNELTHEEGILTLENGSFKGTYKEGKKTCKGKIKFKNGNI